MAQSSKIKVMISSRCKGHFPRPVAVANDHPKLDLVSKGRKSKAGAASNISKSLSEWRKDLKEKIEATEIGGKRLFEVWINEETASQGATQDSWETCMKAALDCDIFIALINGDAGWPGENGTLGICHAELEKATSTAAAKVRIIRLGELPKPEDAANDADKRFLKFVKALNLFSRAASTGDELLAVTNEALHDAVLKLVQSGVTVASKGKFHMGQALDWTRLDFAGRSAAMTSVLRETVLSGQHSREATGHLFISLNDRQILIRLHAIPDALTVGAARESVGQPFLGDHLFSHALESANAGGPLHVIACRKNATESQAQKFLGFPDATVVPGPFGVFAADPVQMMQFAFITNCRDEASTRHEFQRFLEWLRQTGEDQKIAHRAFARARIVKVIAEVAKPAPALNPGPAPR